MTQIKESSTRNANKLANLAFCPINYVMNKIGGHWKPIILFQLLSGAKRYNELKKAIPAVTEKMLIQHLKQLAEDGLIIRTAAQIIPPSVSYQLSPSGEQLKPVLDAMVAWTVQQTT